MNNFRFENLSLFRRLQIQNPAMSRMLIDTYSDIYAALYHLVEEENYPLQSTLAYTRLALLDQGDTQFVSINE